MPPHFRAGASMELPDGLVRSRGKRRRNSDCSPTGAIASRHFGSPGSSQNDAPALSCGGRVWSYWPDLNRRPFVTPKKCAARKPVEWARLFLGTPYGLIFGLTDSNSAHKSKQKSTRKGCLFVWSYWPDLNRRPADYESAALPTEPQ